MMPISFIAQFAPDNSTVIYMKWLGKPDLTTQISIQDLDALIDRAMIIRERVVDR